MYGEHRGLFTQAAATGIEYTSVSVYVPASLCPIVIVVSVNGVHHSSRFFIVRDFLSCLRLCHASGLQFTLTFSYAVSDRARQAASDYSETL